MWYSVLGALIVGLVIFYATRFWYGPAEHRNAVFSKVIQKAMGIKATENTDGMDVVFSKENLQKRLALALQPPKWIKDFERQLSKNKKRKLIDAILSVTANDTDPEHQALRTALLRKDISIGAFMTARLCGQDDFNPASAGLILNLFSSQDIDIDMMIASMVLFSGSVILALRLVVPGMVNYSNITMNSVIDLKCHTCGEFITDHYATSTENVKHIYCKKCSPSKGAHVIWHITPLIMEPKVRLIDA